MRFLDAVEPLLADGIRHDSLEPVVGVHLLDRIEDSRAIRRIACCLEPQLRIDDLKAGSIAFGLEAERQPLTVLRRYEQAIASTGGMRADARVDELRRLGKRNEVLFRGVW